MTRLLRTATLALLLTTPALAQAETLLRLAETARITVRPDELTASLRFEAEAADPAAAQARVNAAITRALAEAKAAPGVTTSTSGYHVWRITQPQTRWRAGQSIDLRSTDGAALLTLVAQLQSQGLTMQNLAWRLSLEATRARQAEATRTALAGLRARVEDAATVLGLRFDSFREIRLDGTRPQPRPMMMRAAAAPAPMPEPTAEPEDITLEATVEADALLK